MTTVQLDRPTPQAPASRLWWHKADLALRAALLAAIVLSWVSLLPIHFASARPAAQLVSDLRAHQVSSIQYERSHRAIRWADGGNRWYTADLASGRPVLGPTPHDTSQIEGDTPANAADRAWVYQAIDGAGLRRQLNLFDGSDDRNWVSPVPWRGLPLLASIAAILSFFLMLGRDRRRFGSRWAWFWVFALAGGGVGPALFLLLEPTPLWPGDARDASFPEQPRLHGGGGFLIGLALKAAVAVGASAVIGWL